MGFTKDNSLKEEDFIRMISWLKMNKKVRDKKKEKNHIPATNGKSPPGRGDWR